MHVLPFLDRQSFKACRTVCRDWREACTYCLTSVTISRLEAPVAAIPTLGPAVSCLCLSNYGVDVLSDLQNLKFDTLDSFHLLHTCACLPGGPGSFDQAPAHITQLKLSLLKDDEWHTRQGTFNFMSLSRLTQLQSLSAANACWHPSLMACLSGLSALTHLEIRAHHCGYSTPLIQSKDLAGLSFLQGLQSLSLSTTGNLTFGSGNDYVFLQHLTALRTVLLDGHSRSSYGMEEGMPHLSGLPLLEDLTLRSLRGAPAGLSHIVSTHLTRLALAALQTSEAYLAPLSTLTNLRCLVLKADRWPQNQPRLLTALSGLQGLTQLVLRGSPQVGATSGWSRRMWSLQAVQCISRLTSLKQLCVEVEQVNWMHLTATQAMTQLTQLETPTNCWCTTHILGGCSDCTWHQDVLSPPACRSHTRCCILTGPHTWSC